MTNLHINIPTSWPDVSRDKLTDIAALFFQNLSPQKFKAKAVMILAGLKRVKNGDKYFDINANQMRYEFRHYEQGNVYITNEQLRAMSEYCSFLLDEIHDIEPLRFRILKNPDKRIYKSIFDQYLNAENEFEAYKNTGREVHLERLMAVFYRYPWQRFNDNWLQRRSRKFRRLSLKKKYLAFMWYAGVRAYISQRFPHLFKGGDENNEPDMFEQVTNMLRALNKGDVTRNKALLKSNVYEALAELEHMSEEAENLKNQKT